MISNSFTEVCLVEFSITALIADDLLTLLNEKSSLYIKKYILK